MTMLSPIGTQTKKANKMTDGRIMSHDIRLFFIIQYLPEFLPNIFISHPILDFAVPGPVKREGIGPAVELIHCLTAGPSHSLLIEHR